MAFLVGVRRSGTNWLRRIVDAHPDANVIPGETYLFSHGLAPLDERVQHGLAGSARTGFLFTDRDRYLDAVRDLCDELLLGYLDTLDHPGRLLAERTPDHVRHLDLIGAVYPDAPVVHIIRDGRDVARSLVSQPWRSAPATYREAAHEWVSGIEAARAAAPRLARYLEVSYEAMLADPVRQVPVLYEFLGLDAGPEVVERAVVEAGVAYNVDPKDRNVGAAKWRGGLAAQELDEVLAVAGPLLAELDYDVTASPTPSRSEGTAPGHRETAVRRAVASGLARAAGRLAPVDDASFQTEVLARMGTTMAVLDALLDDVAARRFDGLERHFSTAARIRVAGGGDAWDERGPAAVARLAALWAADPALAGRQLRGDVHPGVPGFTVVSTWEAGDGSHHDRVLVVDRFGDRIDGLSWYVLPRLPR